jgi:hypothetical protein
MKRKTLIFASVVILALGGLTIMTSSSQANNPLVAFCLKTFPAGPNTKPAVFTLASHNNSCSSGSKFFGPITPAEIVAILNVTSSGMFHNGWALGNYQTSVQDQSQPCIPGQPGCGH